MSSFPFADVSMAEIRVEGSNGPQSLSMADLKEEGASHMNGNSAQEQTSILKVSTIFPRPDPPRPWTSHDGRIQLSPSPALIESPSISKDDTFISPLPCTPKRTTFASRGLSLQMPPRDVSSTSTANLTKHVPQSPKPESPTLYTSPVSALPRRSRGLDFSRACTNLHHSTLAEQSSPDSSPVVGGRGMMIPPRKGFFNSLSASVPDSPGHASSSLWSTTANQEKSLSSSVGSTMLMDYSSGSSSSEDDDMIGAEEEDTIHSTPQTFRNGSGASNPFGIFAPGPGGDGSGGFAVPAARLMSYQRARLHQKKSRKSSSSTSAQSSMHSSGPPSPPLLKSIENGHTWNYFSKDPMKKEISSRRESLSLGTKDIALSDCEESDGGGQRKRSPSDGIIAPTPLTPTMDERRNVIRRAVTRRGNMLPKSKNFSRIKALLQEEGAPIDTEVKREAEVIRQVRESEGDDLSLQLPSQPTTTASSPNILASSGQPDALEDIHEDVTMVSESASRRSSSTFSHQAFRNSGGLGYWNNFDDRKMRTPPPLFGPRGSSSGISDDMNMDTPMSSIQSSTPQPSTSRQIQGSDLQASTLQPSSVLIDPPKKGNKRMRDDDFDPHYLKRRAVSPGLSLQNSPILPQSPQGGWWGLPGKNARESPNVQVLGERVSSGGSSGSVGGIGGTPKRVGMQGMNDTHDGLMNMSIE